jgi:cysteine desulfurase
VDLVRLYLDYNATSPLSQSVLNWLKSGELLFANPSSQHSSGKFSRKLINETRALIYKTFSKTENDSKLFFHSGATESIITFAHSFSEWTRQNKKELLICFSRTDHPAVTALVGKFLGSHVKFFELKISPDLNYQHDENLKVLQEMKASNPDLVILYHHLWVHNETGLVSSLENLSIFKSIPDLYLHIDSVQAPGKTELWRQLDVGDIFSFSAHKFGAMKGLGFSFFKKDLPFIPLISGGGQQGSLRSGTENPLAVISLKLALTDLQSVDVSRNILQRIKLEEFIKAELSGLGNVITHQNQSSNTIYFYLNSYASDIALALFDLEGMEISAGSACSSGAAKESAVLTQMGLHKVARNGLRLSFNFQLSDEGLFLIQERFKRVVSRLRS